jgi:hypothetical protein
MIRAARSALSPVGKWPTNNPTNTPVCIKPALGATRRCLELASAYAKQPGTFGRTLADMNLVRFLDLKHPSELADTNPPH